MHSTRVLIFEVAKKREKNERIRENHEATQFGIDSCFGQTNVCFICVCVWPIAEKNNVRKIKGNRPNALTFLINNHKNKNRSQQFEHVANQYQRIYMYTANDLRYI